MPRRAQIPNPGVPGGRLTADVACGVGRKPVSEISDRAKRYRANAEGCRPSGAKKCVYCGSTRNVGVHHKDGNEDNGAKRNLAWACKSCNGLFAVKHKRAGKGKRTRQFNPKDRVPTFEQYAAAAAEHTRGAHDAAGKVIHATPKSVRREYAEEIWRRRRQRGTDKRDEVPF